MAKRRPRKERVEVRPASAVAPLRSVAHPLIALAALALVVKSIVLGQLRDHPLLQPTGGLDTEAYVQLARAIAGGDAFLAGQPFHLAPLYAYFLGAVFAVGGSLDLARVLQVLLGSAAVVLVADTARRRHGPRAGVLAGALAAATGVLAFNEVLLLQSALDPFLTALGLWLLARALDEDEGRWRGFALAGLAVGLQTLNRPNVLAWAIALPLLLALNPRRRAGALAAALGTVLAIAPVAVRNRVATGEWTLVSTHGGLNLWIGNNPGADGTYRRVEGVTPSIAGQAEDARKVASAALGRPVSDGEASRYFSGRAGGWIAAHPIAALRLFLRKLFYVFHALDLPLNFSYAYYAREEPTLLRLLVVGPWLLVPLGLVGLAEPGGRDPHARWTWAAFVPVYAVSVAAFFVSGRYRLPLLVALTVTAGAAFDAAWRAVQERRHRSLFGKAAATIALGLLVNVPIELDDGRAHERAQMVLSLVDAGRDEEARQRLSTLPTGGLRAATAIELARVALDLRVPMDSRRLAEAAIAAEPSRAEGHEVLGLALHRLGQAREARAALERAVALDPTSASAHLNLAVLLAEVGRIAEARAHATEALRLRPDYPQAHGLLDALPAGP